MAKPKKGELAVVPTQASVQDLQIVMHQEAERRGLITQYIAHHMVSGTDFGTIKFGGKESKPSLFKPGSEKFMSLFKLTARFKKDTETWEMLGSENGTLAYLCELLDSQGRIVGEGRGVSTLKEKQWTPNNAVKIAEKRAQIDAVLRTGGLSDFFTQDLEDMKQEYDKTPIADDAKVIAIGVDEQEIPTNAEEQRTLLAEILRKKGVNFKDKKAVERFVADETGLVLEEANFPKIIEILTF